MFNKKPVRSKPHRLLQTHKPDSVLTLSFICPESYPSGSSCLPSNIGRAALRRWYTWHFSMQGLPSLYVAV